MTRHRIAQIGENRNPKSPENRPQTRRFLQIRLLQLRRSATPFNGLAVLHGRRFKVTLFGLMGRREEGRELLKRLLEFHPGLTVASFKAFYSRLFTPEVVAVHVEGLRKAGLPEN